MRKKLSCLPLCILLLGSLMATTVLAVNMAPGTPTLTGPSTGAIDVLYEFTASAVDPDNDYIAYFFDWGEGNDTGWIMPYAESGEEVTASYSYSEFGTYEITVKAKDVYGHESGLSTAHMITIENNAPETPTITGPLAGGLDEIYMYTFSTTDMNYDDVSYFIDWGDGTNSGWIPFFTSGQTVSDVHSWSSPGEYEIKVKAKDAYDDESEWSENITVKISSVCVQMVSGGFGLTSTIKNYGDISKDVTWTVDLVGGTLPGFHLFNSYEGEVLSLKPGETTTFNTGLVFGLGNFKFTVTAKIAGEPAATKTVDGKILFFYVIL